MISVNESGDLRKKKKTATVHPWVVEGVIPRLFLFNKSLKMLNNISQFIQNSFKNLIFKNLNFFNVNRRLNTSPHHGLIAVLYKIKSTVGLGP